MRMGGETWYRRDNWPEIFPLGVPAGASERDRNIAAQAVAFAEERYYRPLYSNPGACSYDSTLVETLVTETEAGVDLTGLLSADGPFGPLRMPLPDHCCWFGVTCCTHNTTCSNDPDACTACVEGMVLSFTLPFNNVSGSLSGLDQGLRDLQLSMFSALSCFIAELFLQNNDLSGQIPLSIVTLNHVQSLSLNGNRLNGEVPAEISRLVRMRELRVDSNQLSGAFPDICLPNSVNPLTHIYASNNKFTGNVKLGQCRSLVTVDVTANNIVGIESSALSWYLGGARSLRSFSIGGNNLSSLVISGLPANSFIYLTKLDLYGCSLQGTFPTEFARLSYLSYLNFAGNELTGTLPDWMFDNTGMLVHMVGSDNNFNGSIPAPGYSTMLTSLSFSNNQLTGTIPEDIASLLARAPDAELALGYNLMSCCGRGYVGRNTSADEAAFGERGFQAVYSYFDWSAPKIPDSVEFSTNYARQVNLYVGTNLGRMQCPYFLKKGDADEIENVLHWTIDPSYHMYAGCTCSEGYALVNFSTQTQVHMLCEKTKASKSNGRGLGELGWLWLLLGVLGAIVVCTLLMCVMFRRGRRPVLVQYFIDMHKRRRKAPKAGDVVSIVVTDIEGFSDLMKADPENTTKALLLHNNVIGRAKHDSFGYTIEQEGDSFSIMFYDAEDAVKFCLQTQLALAETKWPEQLLWLQEQELRASPEGGGRGAPIGRLTPGGRGLAAVADAVVSRPASVLSRIATKTATMIRRAGSSTLRSQRAFGLLRRAGANTDGSTDGSARVGDTSTRTGEDSRRAGSGNMAANAGSGASAAWHPSGAPVAESTECEFSSDSLGPNCVGGSGNAAGRRSEAPPAPLSGPFGPRGDANTGSAVSMIGARPPPPPSVAASDRPVLTPAWTPDLSEHELARPVMPDQRHMLAGAPSFVASKPDDHARSAPRAPGWPILGMRVRMGISTGMLPPTGSASSSPVMSDAKQVSDAAAGGQVFMCTCTFNSVSHHTAELGLVGSRGLKSTTGLGVDKDRTSSIWRALSLANGDVRHQLGDTSALLLDMGEYVLPPSVAVSRRAATTLLAGVHSARMHSIHSDSGNKAMSLRRLNAAATELAGSLQRTDDFSHSRVDVHSDRRLAPPVMGCIDPLADRDDGKDTIPGARLRLRLYQVLAPSLVGRGRHFGSATSLKSEWVCVDQPYFSAPGVELFPLSPRDLVPTAVLAREQQPVAVAFICVEGGKVWAATHRDDARVVQRGLLLLTRHLLREVPGGYLVKEQSGELKIMLAFRSGRVAHLFLAAMQEAAMAIDWPAAAQKQWPRVDGPDGLPLFNGPRLKMGVCAGHPRSIMPDYLGRADYLGDAVNQAARFMDAAAHGGQLVTSRAFVEQLSSGVPPGELTPLVADWGTAGASGAGVGARGGQTPRSSESGVGGQLHAHAAWSSASAPSGVGKPPGAGGAADNDGATIGGVGAGNGCDTNRTSSGAVYKLPTQPCLPSLSEEASASLTPSTTIASSTTTTTTDNPASAATTQDGRFASVPNSWSGLNGSRLSAAAVAERALLLSDGASAPGSPVGGVYDGRRLGCGAAADSGRAEVAQDNMNHLHGLGLNASAGLGGVSGVSAGLPAHLATARQGGQLAPAPRLCSTGSFGRAAAAESEESPSRPSRLQPGTQGIEGDGPWPANALVDGGFDELLITDIGSFRFKGSLQVLPMVNVCLASLAKRTLPREPPKGKGGRVRDGTGAPLARVRVPLLTALHRYRQRLLALPSAAAVAAAAAAEAPHRSAPSFARAATLVMRGAMLLVRGTAGSARGEGRVSTANSMFARFSGPRTSGLASGKNTPPSPSTPKGGGGVPPAQRAPPPWAEGQSPGRLASSSGGMHFAANGAGTITAGPKPRDFQEDSMV